MPSVPGKGGALPKRSSERMGHRSKADMETEKLVIPGVVKVPTADPNWHKVAKSWYASLAESGQSVYFEPSDWAAAQFTAEAMTHTLDIGGAKISSSLFTAVWSAMNDLLTTEGARRRVRLELERTGKDDAKNAKNAAVLDEYRRRVA